MDVVDFPDPDRPITAIRRGRVERGGRTTSATRPAIRSFRTPSDTEDDDQRLGTVDHTHDAQVTDAEPPEVGAGELRGACGSGLDRKREDRAAKACRVTRGKLPQFPLRRRRELDSMTRVTHPSSVP
jgi:hypothetical protein